MYFVPTNPSSTEHSTYNRFEVFFKFDSRTNTWTWGIEDAGTASPVRAQQTVDGTPIGGWTAPSGKYYPFTYTTSNGDHIASAVFESPLGLTVVHKPFVVNDTAVALPGPRRPWVALTRLELTHVGPFAFGVADTPKQVTPPAAGWRPYAAKLKPRVPQTTTTRLTYAQTRCRTVWGPDARYAMFRDFKRTTKGDTYIAAWEKYPYGGAISLGEFKAGLKAPTTLCRDGPRNWNTFGYVCQVRLRVRGLGFWFLESNGRLGFVQFAAFSAPAGIDITGSNVHPGEGQCDTFVGWRVTDAMQVEQTEAGLEYVGDFTRCKGFTRWHEPWGFALGFREKDGTLSNRNGNDLWVTSTLDHWIAFVDQWAAHPDVSSLTGRPSAPHFPPAGYVFPGKVGKAQVVHLFGNTPTLVAGEMVNTPSATVNQPWGIGFRIQDQKLYWSNFAGHSISRGNTDGTGQVVILKGDKVDSQLGINTLLSSGKRLNPSILPLAVLQSYVRDGPLATASCICPQALDFDSNGNMIFVERYTYAVRRIDFAAGTVTTILKLTAGQLTLGSGSSGTQDIALAIDTEGTFGPKDDIFISAWGGPTAYRISADGTFMQHLADLSTKPFRNGQWSRVDPPNYAWAIDVHLGRFIWHGNDSGSQLKELTKLVVGDPIYTQAQEDAIARGLSTFNKYFLSTHGSAGYGTIGYPNVEEIGSWTDAVLLAYLVSWGGIAAEAPDFIAWVRSRTVDFDYSAPLPNLPPDAPTAPLALVSIN